ncbi:hypothetical protein GGTG_04712 [Gaeumannomyces tritici R3-111a-1]|uniref:Secreted protein n=1 Tax=Gaeumannomyces tritici (strain R3-111a-1) TaxID=644352 RepID=J3NTW3_GAET3|nr:hypothetical protein GGTG_04712 [Gaeumannomyces tritici R3-111a-1]EJT79628.1 hypothetical protein GGTG_04712 [Gaeumannomyces tritici R3-111a-1]
MQSWGARPKMLVVVWVTCVPFARCIDASSISKMLGIVLLDVFQECTDRCDGLGIRHFGTCFGKGVAHQGATKLQ